MKSYDIKITAEKAKAAVLGGVFLGGGGGGAVKSGMETAGQALEQGEVHLVSLDRIDSDATVVTASAVGSPASKEGYVTVEHCKRAAELYGCIAGTEIAGVITNENGGHSTTNGWVLSAVAGIPVIDAPCNGRAHPTARMGSMGLSMDPLYESWQVAVGGNDVTGKYLEAAVWGRLERASRMVRRAAVEAGGLVTVLRNSVKAGFLRENAAPGAILQAMEIGEVFIRNEGRPDKILGGLAELLEIELLAEGKVRDLSLVTKDGFDVGELKVDTGKNTLHMTFWNEYMTAEINGERIATFPDLLVTMERVSGKVRTSAEIREGSEIIVLKVPRKDLILGQGMFDVSLFEEAEKIIGKPLVPYNFL